MLNSLMKSHPKLKATGLAVAALALGAGVAATGVRSQALAAGDEFSAPQKLAIEAIIKDYLLKNPEVLMEVQQALESRMDEIREKQLSKALPDNAEFLFRRANAPAVNVDGDVTVVEFFDYNCGYCKRGFGDLAKLIESDKKVKVVFKEFPIFGKDSEAAAKIAVAAKAQGKYWEVHKALISHEGKVNEEVGLKLAEGLGLDMAKLKADMGSDAVLNEIKEVRQAAEKLGIQGTPHFFVGDKVIPGAPEDLFAQLTERVAEIRKNGCKIC